MSTNATYDPRAPLSVISPSEWRRRPELYLGSDHHAWWFILMQRCLAEVGDPARRWTRASLQMTGPMISWTDDAEEPLVRLNLFWRDACVNLKTLSQDGHTHVSFSVDPLIPFHPQPSNVVRLAMGCTARRARRSVDVAINGTFELTVLGAWSDYATHGVYAVSTSRVTADSFIVEAVSSKSDEAATVEVLERGVTRGNWPELTRLVDTAKKGSRFVLHSEATHSPQEREYLATAALKSAMDTVK